MWTRKNDITSLAIEHGKFECSDLLARKEHSLYLRDAHFQIYLRKSSLSYLLQIKWRKWIIFQVRFILSFMKSRNKKVNRYMTKTKFQLWILFQYLLMTFIKYFCLAIQARKYLNVCMNIFFLHQLNTSALSTHRVFQKSYWTRKSRVSMCNINFRIQFHP
jgi:hypothetical protein